MAQIYNNLGGTTRSRFKIGKGGPTLTESRGAALRISTTAGTITVPTVFTDPGIPTGFLSGGSSSLSFVDGTRTFRISTGSSYSVYVGGLKTTVTTTQSVQIRNVEGLHYIYFNASGVLSESTTFTQRNFATGALVSTVYWDVTDAKHIYMGDNRFGLGISYRLDRGLND